MSINLPVFSLFALTCSISSAAMAGGVNFTVHSQANGDFCMDAQGDAKKNGTKVFIYKCHGKENQRWAISDDENGQSAFIGTGGFCLDVRGAHAKTDGTPIELWKCHFGANQRFKLESNGEIKEAASGKCLQAMGEKDGAAIVLDECKGTPAERWTFKK